jgi:hypothetical protein
MVTEALSLRCANSPLTLTCSAQAAQLSSAAETVGAGNHRLAQVTRERAATRGEKPDFRGLAVVADRLDAAGWRWMFIF